MPARRFQSFAAAENTGKAQALPHEAALLRVIGSVSEKQLLDTHLPRTRALGASPWPTSAAHPRVLAPEDLRRLAKLPLFEGGGRADGRWIHGLPRHRGRRRALPVRLEGARARRMPQVSGAAARTRESVGPALEPIRSPPGVRALRASRGRRWDRKRRPHAPCWRDATTTRSRGIERRASPVLTARALATRAPPPAGRGSLRLAPSRGTLTNRPVFSLLAMSKTGTRGRRRHAAHLAERGSARPTRQALCRSRQGPDGPRCPSPSDHLMRPRRSCSRPPRSWTRARDCTCAAGIEAARAAVADRAHMPRAHDGQVAALARHLRHGRFWMWEERARDKRISCHPTLADSFS